MLTQEIVKEFMNYDPETGILTWKHRDRKWCKDERSYNSWNTSHYNKICGSIHPNSGYNNIRIFNKTYRTHRIIWLYVYGTWPNDQLDHINGNRQDNRLCNLRECTNSENQQNKKIRKDNSSGFMGVSFSKKSQKFQSHIKVNTKSLHLGLFDDAKEAHEAYLEAKQKYHTFNPIPRNHLDNVSQVG